VWFGCGPSADLRISSIRQNGDRLSFALADCGEFELPIPGPHNAYNAAAAIAVARSLAVEPRIIAAQLAAFRPPAMRLAIERVGPLTIVNDAYNANPASVRAAIDTLATMPNRGRRVGVFGEMRELGPHSANEHRKVAEYLRNSGVFDVTVLVGPAVDLMHATLAAMPQPAECVTMPTVEACGSWLADNLREGDLVLLKASRAVALERVLPFIRLRFDAAATPGQTSSPTTAGASAA
jgi:UDP-N-acetylmuramyl pentapeptide synthase